MQPCAHPHACVVHPYRHDPEADDAVAAECARLWFVTAISNPARFKTRHALYRKFRHHIVEELGANLVTVECAFGDRGFQLTESNGVTVQHANGARTIDVQVVNSSFVWLKENLQALGAARLPRDAAYIVFCDADVTFCNRNILAETVHALQAHRVVQPFSTICDMGPDGEVMTVHRSFGACYAAGLDWRPSVPAPVADGRRRRAAGPNAYASYGAPSQQPGTPGPFWHCGYALAFRRSVYDKLGLLTEAALGAGDHHMMTALIGKAAHSYPEGIHPNYKKAVLAWQERALKVVKHDLGYVPGNINHAFHGPKAGRQYVSRWDVLTKHAFDPEADLYRNGYGVWEVRSDRVGLRDGMRNYFLTRLEDATRVE